MGTEDLKAPAPEAETIEAVEMGREPRVPGPHGAGTVRLLDENTVVLIPTPSPDPKDPLNLPAWRKFMVIFIVGVYSAFAVATTSGLGAVYPEVMAAYPGQEAQATDLLTYPTLFMGIGNLIAMPLCVAIGRRPVFLLSMVLLVASGIWCACSKSLSSHIAGRDIFSMAAGQSEALAPMIVQEIHFLHERGSKVAWFVGVQTVGTAAFFVATVYIVPAIGLGWWYGIITIINGIVLIMAFFFVVETKFERPEDALEGEVHLHLDENGDPVTKGGRELLFRVTTAQNHVLQPEKFGPRTWRHDLKVFHGRPDWKACLLFYKDTALGLALPTIFWLVVLNGAFLGVYVYQASTFAQILVAPPYSFTSADLGWVQLAQVLDCVIMVPLLGYGSDRVVKLMSRWRKGIFEPEYRLIVLAIPAVAVVISCVLYGQAGQFPNLWSWLTIVAPYHLGYFAFLGANLVGITYAVDSFPDRAGPLLLLICAGRGFISFGLSYSTVPLISLTGYNGAMNIFAIICGVLSALGIAAYVFGGVVRRWATRTFWKPLDHTY
ncbi:major facilitator superfamily domain-containing protein [Pestalotiopsis sp. NC0098]|nr:major facilitator superfamily domain-containing protein [Pestalotiopsis sp. NC0098]